MAAKTRLLVFVGLMLALCGPGLAQDETAPLLQMLALVPDTTAVRASIISYADYRAMEAARGIETPSALDFTGQKRDLGAQWIAASQGLAGGMVLQTFSKMLDGMADAVGFGFFDIDRSLVFGDPPGNATIVAGHFHGDRIARAYQARGFSENTQGAFSIWCGPEGCDSGLKINFDGLNPANPFGGQFGRAEPLAMLSDQVLADSASFDTLSQVLDAAAGDTPSLADAPDYRALAEAMIAQGSVVQVQFISPAVLLPDPAAPQTPEDWGSLPPYTVLGIADLSTGDEQIALIAIPYADSATALEAGTVISARLQSYQSVVADSAYMDLLTARGATLAAPDVYASETNGQALALIALHYPLATGSAASSQVFRLLMNSIYQRDAAFLASDA